VTCGLKADEKAVQNWWYNPHSAGHYAAALLIRPLPADTPPEHPATAGEGVQQHEHSQRIFLSNQLKNGGKIIFQLRIPQRSIHPLYLVFN